MDALAVGINDYNCSSLLSLSLLLQQNQRVSIMTQIWRGIYHLYSRYLLLRLSGIKYSLITLSILLIAINKTSGQDSGEQDESYPFYINKIALSEALLQLGKPGEASAILRDCDPVNRDIEWHFLNRFLHQEKLSLTPHNGEPVFDLVLNPQGNMLATAGGDSIVRVFRYPSMEPYASFKGHEGAVSTLDFSPDGSILASGGRDNSVILWDLSSKSARLRITEPFTQGIYQLRFHPDNARLGVVTWERRDTAPSLMGFVLMINWQTEKILRKIDLEPHPAAGVLFSPDGEYMYVNTWGELAYCYKLEDSSRPVWTFDKSDNEEYNSFHANALSPDGKTLLLGATDHRIWVLDAQTGEVKYRIEPWEGHSRTIKALAFSPAGTEFISGGEDLTIYHWRTEDGHLLGKYHGHEGTVSSLGFHPQFDRWLSASRDGTIKQWDPGSPVERPYSVCDYGPWDSPVSANDSIFAAPCSDMGIGIYHLPTGKLLQTLEGANALSAVFGKNDNFLATASFDGIVRWWDLNSGELLANLTGHTGRVDGLSYFPRQNWILSAGDTTVRIWDPFFRVEIQRLDFPDLTPFRVLVGGSNSDKIIIGFSEGLLKVISLPYWEEEANIELPDAPLRMALSGNNDFLALSYSDGSIELIDLQNPERRKTFRGHTAPVYALDFVPNDRYLVSGSYDQTFKFWNIDREACTFTWHGYSFPVFNAKFSHNSRWLVLTGPEGQVYTYDFGL